ncbi:MAG: hypothetical protein WC242_03125 [Candidatus Paceibacterota bacterium]|jgi:hypothetical protein
MKNNLLSKNPLPILIIIVFIIISVIILIFVLSKKNDTVENQSEARLTQVQSNIQSGFDENFSTTTPNDLIVGESVMVFGLKDSNGVISSERIVLGMTQEDFKNQPGQFMGGEPGQNPNTASSPDGNTTKQENRFRGNPPQGFQDLSPEELEKMRTARDQGRQRLSGQMETIFGKITQKDDASITVVSDDGSSKYILYSQTTKILEPKEIIE